MKKSLMVALMVSLMFSLMFTAPLALAQDARFTVTVIDTGRQRLELFLNDEAGQPFNSFSRLARWLQARGKKLAFGVNAGMYHANFAPVGLLVQDGKEMAPLNLDDGVGNFFLKPNGVFLVGPGGPQVVASTDYPALAKGVRLATQSGPMLVQHGVIHPGFNPASASRTIRNGVGVLGSKAIFVISNHPVTFHEFAVFFRDNLKCSDALYLDGAVSSLYWRELGRNDGAAKLGPMLGVLE